MGGEIQMLTTIEVTKLNHLNHEKEQFHFLAGNLNSGLTYLITTVKPESMKAQLG